MLYKTLDDVKSSAGFVAISNSSGSIDILREDLIAAEQEVRRKYLGAATFDLLELQYNSDAIVADTNMDKLLKHTRRYVSHIALQTGAPKLNVNFSKSGITSPKSQTSVPAREWMLQQLKLQLLNSACDHLDNLLRFLEENRAEFLTWDADNSVNTIQRRFFVQSLDEFEKYYALGGSHSTFKALWPIIDHLQERELRGILTDVFYENLITELKTDSVSGENNTLLTKFVKRWLVYKTVYRACELLPVRLTHNGLKTNQFIASYEANSQESKATLKEKEQLQVQMLKDCDELKEDLITYLNQNASAILYSDWFASDKYDDPSDDEDEDNDVNSELSGFYTM